MEIIFEFLFELIIGGFVDESGNAKIPRFIRIIFALLLILPLVVLMAIIIVASSQKANYTAVAICSCIIVLMLVLGFFLIRKILKN